MDNPLALVSVSDEHGNSGSNGDKHEKHEDGLDDPELIAHLGVRSSGGTALVPSPSEGDMEGEYDADGVLGTDSQMGVEDGVEGELNEELWQALDLSKSAMGTGNHPEDEQMTLREILGGGAHRPQRQQMGDVWLPGEGAHGSCRWNGDDGYDSREGCTGEDDWESEPEFVAGL